MGGGIPSLSDTNLAVLVEELCRGSYTAEQFLHVVTLKAEGSHPTGGYQVFLKRNPVYVFPPSFTLTHIRPVGEANQQITPFLKTSQFECIDAVKEILIVDAAGSHQVEVKQVKGEGPETPTCE
jgi:hypothetical protein